MEVNNRCAQLSFTMSNIYIQEPPTNGKVLLNTSVGDVDIELWPKEAPKACRNFIQLCLENYYNGTVFHRVIKDFIAQGGDPTGTGDGGESVYGKPFRDEIHTRLRFVRRGLVAMANSGKDDNGSQFFITLGPTQELQGKHTIFGKIAGETIYNLIKMNDLHTDDNDRPVAPPKIKKTEVLFNPFDDIVPRETIKHEKTDSKKKKKSQSIGKKDFKLLSFGEEAEEDEEMTKEVVETMKSKGKSAHDLADDPRLSNVAGDLETPVATIRASEEDIANLKQKLQQYNSSTDKPASSSRHNDASNLSKLDELKKESRKLQKELKNKNVAKKESDDEAKDDANIPEALAEYKKERDSYSEKHKAMLKKGSKREEQTLAILEKFKNKLSTVQTLSNQYDDEGDEGMSPTKPTTDGEVNNEDETDEGWMSHKLTFGDAHGKVIDANVTDVDRYELFDPRNPMTKRRNEEANKDGKRRRKDKNQVV